MGTKRCLRITMSVLLCVVFAGLSSSTWARTIYVDDDAAEPQDGSSWAAAFQDLQDAVAVASSGDEIRVAQGVYCPAHPASGAPITQTDRGATFHLIGGLTVLGGFAGLTEADPDLRAPSLFATILTGDLRGDDDPNTPLHFLYDNSYHVVTVGDGHNTLDGVTVTRAIAKDRTGGGVRCSHGNLLVRNCTFLENYAEDEGGGIYNWVGTLRLENCRFVRNVSWFRGGGVSNDGGTVQVTDCEFIDNYALGEGGGIDNQEGSLRIEHSRFLRNRASRGAGVLINDQGSVEVIASEFVANHSDEGMGGVSNQQGSAVFFGCLFRANDGVDGEGALHSSGPLSLLYCTFADNRGDDSPGALHCRAGDTVIAHCLFHGNVANSEGAIEVTCSQALVEQCTFYANVAGNDLGGALSCPESYCPIGEPGPGVPGDAGTVTVRGCIFWANRALDDEAGTDRVMGYEAQLAGDPNRVVVEYSCIEGWMPEYGGTGNIGDEPLFVAPDQNDFHLKSQAGHWDAVLQAWVLDDITSPCIDAGDPNSPVEHEPFPNGGIVNMGAYGGTCEASKSWFGAEPCPTINAADINGDCRVDAEDYRLTAARWLRPEASE